MHLFKVESLGLDEEDVEDSDANDNTAEDLGPELQGVEHSKVIDILLVESDTIWMLQLSGELSIASDLHRTN